MKSVAPDTAVSAERYGAYGAEYRFSPVEQSTDEAMRWLFACWNEMRGERDMPQRDELNPRALGPFLRNVQLFEVVDGGKDFRCRVYGTGLYEVTGLHMTGQQISEFDNARIRERMLASLHRVLETGLPVRLTVERSALAHLPHKGVEAIWLPLGGREGITHVLSGCVFHTRPA